MKQLLKNPKARIGVLAVLVVGGAYFLMRGKGAASDPTAGLPVQPSTIGTGMIDTGSLGLGGMGTGIGDSSSTVGTPIADFGDNGFQQAVDALKAQVTDATDYFNTVASGGSYTIPDAIATDTGAGNPTNGRTVSGDGSAALPGNAVAAATLSLSGKTTVRRLAAAFGHPLAPATPAKKGKKRRNRPKVPKVGQARLSVTRSGAVVVTRAQPRSNVVAIASALRGSGGGGYSPPTYAAPAVVRAAPGRTPGGGGGYQAAPAILTRGRVAAITAPAPRRATGAGIRL